MANGERGSWQTSGVKHFRVLFLERTGSTQSSVLPPPPPLWLVNLEVCVSPCCPDGSSLERDGDILLLLSGDLAAKSPSIPG